MYVCIKFMRNIYTHDVHLNVIQENVNNVKPPGACCSNRIIEFRPLIHYTTSRIKKHVFHDKRFSPGEVGLVKKTSFFCTQFVLIKCGVTR